MAGEHYLAVLKAQYDYEPDAGADDEIAIKDGQILFLKERVDQDWWKVKIKGETQEEDTPVGLVPAAYVEPAEHSSVVKALYDYEASAPGELTITEDQILVAFDADDEWLLVQTDEDGGKAGYVPANYVESYNGEEEDQPAAPQIVVPDSPPKPAYVDPATRVASSKITADDIKTWSVSEVDKKGKKKKGTLGVGNGAVFFASEADKTPVQKWQTAHIQDITVEKSKHIHIDVGGPNAVNLHFSVGSKDNADAIVTKLNSSKEFSSASAESSTSARESSPGKDHKKATVHFAPESPTVIPIPDEDEEEEVQEEETTAQDDNNATARYDFTADGDDELSVVEGEHLIILERDGDEWWKCRNAKGQEGVVPAAYLEAGGGGVQVEEEDEDDSAAIAAAREEEEERAEAERQRKAREKERAERERVENERLEKERQEKEKKKQEAQKRARETAAAAEKEREKRKQAAAARPPTTSPPPVSRTPPEPKKSESKARTSPDPVALPPQDRVRVWHDRSGQFRVDAAFLGFNNGKLRLHKVNGVIVEVPAEKMSVEDMKYVEKMTNKQRGSRTSAAASRAISDDDVPLATVKRASMAVQPKKGPTIDWFDFFLSAGCDIDDCTRYASSFERDKMDESILLDITDSTMRSLGLREGDIIRVSKAIEKRRPPAEKKIDEGEDSGGPTKSPPNLFTTAGGALKNPRRGRPQASKSSTLPGSVDMQAISSVSDQMQRTTSPKALSPTTVQPPPRSSSALLPATSGFDDDAWTNRPSSTQPTPSPSTPAPAVAATPPPPAAAQSPAPVAPTPPVPTVQTPPVVQTTPSLAKTTEADVFDQLARLSALRSQTPQAPPVVATPPAALPTIAATPTGYVSGLGMGSSPVPMGQHLVNQQGGLLPSPSPQPPTAYTGPRGPYAPVPANQTLLQPLIPTTTGFNSFVPTRASASPFGSSLLPTQPTGFPGSLQPQPTGFMPQQQQPLSFQPTGSPFGGNSFVQSNPTGFAQSPFNNVSPFSNPGFASPPPVPPLPSSTPQTNNTSPANIFAQMKSGTFGTEDGGAPQSADRYDALRPNPMVAQPTGWVGGYQNGFGGYH
ncbi:hypothetical protein MIND_00729800 [Mycena indigotica]|uniref:Actin cytoskeleton-regulatory complex protein SLA1 n=1 Tax=Mycena indigotica TaxID=2126181 RepID=A0A8H6SMA4_9AGAR|nr:uncharacterized protein MIND_00729800 [Mycena indigotica]KAF7301643.1 hypothetical protein MIND_00729800 [Mycena indigotica]